MQRHAARCPSRPTMVQTAPKSGHLPSVWPEFPGKIMMAMMMTMMMMMMMVMMMPALQHTFYAHTELVSVFACC